MTTSLSLSMEAVTNRGDRIKTCNTLSTFVTASPCPALHPAGKKAKSLSFKERGNESKNVETRTSETGMNKVGTAYVLWLGCLLQLHGLHRLYNGKILTGLLWMFTFGLLGFGQMIDLLLIPNMVEEHNTKLRERQGLLPEAALPLQPVIQRVVDVEA